MAEHNLPWSYRPYEFDDWGWIRDAEGYLAARATRERDGKTYDEHRADGTDPYGEYASFIVKAVNAWNDVNALRRRLAELEAE